MAILWLRYPTDVKQSVRIIPVEVQLPAGSAVANLAVVAGQTSPNTSLYTENGVVVSRLLAGGLVNSYEVYLSVSTLDDHDTFVLPVPTATPPILGINPQAEQAIVVALRETVTGEQTEAIAIKIAPIPADTVTSEKTLFSDDFSSNVLNHDNWTATRTVAGVAAAPNQTVAASLLSLNNAVVALGYTDIVSDVIEGRCHIEFRGAIESVRRADCSFIFGAYFVDLESTAIVDLTNQLQGFLAFGINWRNTGYVNDLATTVEIMHGQNSALVGPNTPIVLAAGGVTTTAHLFAIDFDGHSAVFSIDGTVVATITTRIPSVASKRFIVVMSSRTTGVPAGVNRLDIDRVDVASDERLVTTNAAGGGGGGIVVNVDLQGQIESQPAPSPSSVRGALGDLALIEEPDGALRTRARVLTDEDSFVDDFGGGAVAMVRALTGNCTFTLGSTAVVGQAGVSLFMTEARIGDYVALNADGAAALAQVASVTDNEHLTLVAAYTGAGGAAGPSSVQNYFEQIVGAAGNAVAAGIMTLDVTAAAGDDTSIMRAIGAGGRKASLPVRCGFFASIDQRRANQLGEIGVYNPITGQLARFLFDGVLASVVKATSQSSATAGDLWDETVALPVGTTATYHWYEIILLADRAVFFIDYQRVAEHPYHLPDPYAPLWLYAELQNTGASGVTNFNFDWLGYNSFDDVRVEAMQPDASKLQVTAHDSALVQSLPAPDPAAVLGSTPTSMQLEPDHALRTRARVLTDEGSFADDFAADLGFALTGNVTFLAGSNQIVGQAGVSLFLAELRQGDYVDLGADHSTLAPVEMQVLSVEDDEHATLVAAYAGGGGTGAAGRYRWLLECGAGATITRPGGTTICRLNPGIVNAEQARIVRWFFLGAPAKGFVPFDLVFQVLLDNRRANQTSWLALNTLGGGLARFFFDGGVADTTVRCDSRPANDAAATLSRDALIPIGGHAADEHLYRMRVRADRVDFWIDDGNGAWVLVDSHPWHVPYPYDPCYVEILIGNDAAMDGDTHFDVDLAIIENHDAVRAEVECLDETKLRASVKDITPSSPTHGVLVALVNDNSTLVATVEVGKRYRISAEGGEGTVWTNSAGPAARATDDPIWYMMAREFIAVHTQVYAQKLLAGTVNHNVKTVPLDGGTIA